MTDPEISSGDHQEEGGIYCPECGYDLRHIPEHRCPECGFGYDHAAVRSIAAGRVFKIDSAYRHMIILSVAALALLTPQICRLQRMNLIPSILLIAGAVMVACFTYSRCSDLRAPRFADHLLVRVMIGLLLIWFGSMLLILPQVGIVLAGISVFVAWFLGTRVILQSPTVLQMSSPDIRLVVHKRRMLAFSAATIATVIFFVLW